MLRLSLGCELTGLMNGMKTKAPCKLSLPLQLQRCELTGLMNGMKTCSFCTPSLSHRIDGMVRTDRTYERDENHQVHADDV